MVKALEDENVRFTFGIPGTHNIELYDALERSKTIEPILVTDEQSASFMADGVSRTSDSIGVVNVVPGAGVTHCLSGVAEALMDNIPLLVLACGVRRDTGNGYQLHDIDQLAVLRPVTKADFKVERAQEIYPLLRKAIQIAREGTPGPVAIEIPANFYFLHQEIAGFEYEPDPDEVPRAADAQLDQAAAMLAQARHPLLYVGLGATRAREVLVELAEKLAIPVTTTIQGKGVFPESHPLWLWNGFGPSAPSFVRKITDPCDCLLAVGCRFGEVATASYGFKPPENLIHVDINSEVFDQNYPAKLAVHSDSLLFLEQLVDRVEPGERVGAQRVGVLKEAIAQGHRKVRAGWRAKAGKEKVTPVKLFEGLQARAGEDAIYVTDSGNGTFLAMEQLRLHHPACFIGPVDYSCMGYCAPAAIGAKLANPERDVVALAGDGALLMTGLEMLTASSYRIAPLFCVLRDGELGQIAQFQRTSLNRDTCSVLPPYDLASLAQAVHCRFLNLPNDDALDGVLDEAFSATREGQPVVIDVRIDYSSKTYFTKGVVTTNFWRLPLGERVSMIVRAVGRKVVPGR